MFNNGVRFLTRTMLLVLMDRTKKLTMNKQHLVLQQQLNLHRK